MTSTLVTDIAFATLANELARGPNLHAIRRQFHAADVALADVEHALDATLREPTDPPDPSSTRVLIATGHRAYLAALTLAITIGRLLRSDERDRDVLVRWQRTAIRMLDTVERIVLPSDRALRTALLEEPSAARAQA